MASKRRRVEIDQPATVTIFRQTKRPVDKKIIYVTKAGLADAQQTTTLITATFPFTMVGLRWEITIIQDAGTAQTLCAWAIVIVREGVTVDTMSVGDGDSFFQPEENVLVYGTTQMEPNVEAIRWMGSTKSMRKFQGGDTLQLIIRGSNTNTVGMRGIIQFFCKT